MPTNAYERPSQGYEPNEDKKDVTIEPEKPNLDDSYMLISTSKSYANPPIMDQMPTEERLALINDAVNYLAGDRRRVPADVAEHAGCCPHPQDPEAKSISIIIKGAHPGSCTSCWCRDGRCCGRSLHRDR